MSPATSTNTLRGAKHSRTRAPLTSFSPNRSSKATECSAHIPWRILCNECGGDFRRFTSEIFATHLGTEAARLAGRVNSNLSERNRRHRCHLTNASLVNAIDPPIAALPRFGLRSLLDLLQTGISVADPIPRLIDLRWINWNRARNFFASRY